MKKLKSILNNLCNIPIALFWICVVFIGAIVGLTGLLLWGVVVFICAIGNVFHLALRGELNDVFK